MTRSTRDPIIQGWLHDSNIVALPCKRRMMWVALVEHSTYYHPMTSFLMVWNWAGGRLLVNPSAVCSSEGMYLAMNPFWGSPYLSTVAGPMKERNQWYFRARYLFLGDILGTFTRERHPWLSSKMVDSIKDSFNELVNNIVRVVFGESSLNGRK